MSWTIWADPLQNGNPLRFSYLTSSLTYAITYAITYGIRSVADAGGTHVTSIAHRHGDEETLVLAQAPAGMERQDHRLSHR